jgi:hypothetical protein
MEERDALAELEEAILRGSSIETAKAFDRLRDVRLRWRQQINRTPPANR